MIELYIENKKIDLTEDLEINFTYETIDPDKLASIKNSFSKTVNIPGTANNNITFGHIFRYDKYIFDAGDLNIVNNIDNNYDPHKRVKWFINKNGSLVNRGYCVLDNILIKSERDITYQLTLYGGLGEFFYSLSYNEDGSPKTLADMFWNWFPRTSLYTHGAALDAGAEDTQTLYKASADIVASSYHSLNPLYTYEGTTDIDKDVVFVPCYTGLYEDFDSKHMLVSTFNQNYLTSPKYISDEKKASLIKSFPDNYTDPADGKTYRTLDKNFSSSGAYRYGLVTFSRDVDPWEAGDIRINELPVAIRLSKLMHVISQPENNGGYEVIWDDDIKQSLHWLYSWVLFGKLKQEKEAIVKYSLVPNPTYDGQNLTVNYAVENQGAATTSTTITYDLFNSTIEQGTYAFSLNVIPKLNFNVNNHNDYWAGRNAIYDWVSASYTIGVYGHNTLYYSRWNTFVVINKFYLGKTTIKNICDVFYFAQNVNNNKFGEVTYGNYNSQFLDNLKTMLETHYSITIDKIDIHNCEALYSNYNGDQYGVPTINYEVQNQQINTTLEISSPGSLRIEQTQVMCFTIGGYFGPRSGIWGVDNPNFAVGDSSKLGFFGFVISKNYTDSRAWNTVYNFSITINESRQNGLTVSKSAGFNIMNIDKKTLFANSKSPMRYLSGFCKIMNYRFVCDNTSQKIYIHTLKDYYKNNIINLDDRVDIGRSISIKNLTTKNKKINIGLDTPETYPVNLFNKNSREKFNTYRYDTKIEFPAGEANLLDNLTFKNTIDWQQSSIFYNIYPQISRPYATQSISWTLFDPKAASTDEIKKKEIFTVGVPSTVDTMIANIDFLPKMSLFDKDNKFVDVESSFIFLNGFVKNYDYSLSQNDGSQTLSYTLNPDHYVSGTGVETASQTQSIKYFTVSDLAKEYRVTAHFTSTQRAYTVYYYDANNTLLGRELTQQSATYNNVLITLPQGTTTIKMNCLKDALDEFFITMSPVDINVISPKVMFSNDTYEQYYLNQSRCYVYDFKYNDTFVGWGEYSMDQKGSATSWAIPMFSRDLYNAYIPDIQKWQNSITKLASWNISNQEGLDTLYSLIRTKFLLNPNYNYPKITNENSYLANEYSIASIPEDDEFTERIYDKNWKDYIDDLYDRNARDITAYVDLSGLGDASEIMRKIYSYKSHLWVIIKLENFKIAETTHDKFTKVTMHKIDKLSTWTN
jgi:hypothetical protein